MKQTKETQGRASSSRGKLTGITRVIKRSSGGEVTPVKARSSREKSAEKINEAFRERGKSKPLKVEPSRGRAEPLRKEELLSAFFGEPSDPPVRMRLEESPRAVSNKRPSVAPGAEIASLSMRDLQKITAADIAAMNGAVPLKSNGRVVALLLPLNPARPEALKGLVEAAEADAAARTPEEQARIDAELARYDAEHK